MTWHIPNLQDALNAGTAAREDFQWRQLRGRSEQAQCACGAWRRPTMLTNVARLPGVVQNWACDGCLTHWERTGVDVDSNGPVADRKAWRLRVAAAMGAPDSVIEKVRGTRQPSPYGRIRKA